jgi:hypothetical protein
MPDQLTPDPERLVPVRAARYEGLLNVFTEAIREHGRPLVRGGHGKPPVDCPLCTALRSLIASGAPEVGPDERAYLDDAHPRQAGERAR